MSGSHESRDRVERAARRAKAKNQATDADWADVVYALWMQNAGKDRRQTQMKKANRTRDKVQSWLDSTT
jgi:hypothetical protein